MIFIKILENKKLILNFIIVNIFLFILLPQSPLYPNYNTCLGDSGIYQIIAKEMLNGKALYTEIFDHKGPFIFFIYLIPALFKNVNIPLFLIELILLNLIFIYTYKTLKIFNISKNKIILTFILTLLFIFIFIKILVPETIMLFIVTYLNYWILSKQYLKPTKSQLIFCGILTGIIFWTKFTLCIYIGVIFIYFIIKNFKWKHILYPLIGFLIPTIIIFGYFIYNNNLNDLINTYFLINIKYRSNELVNFNNKLIISSLILLLTTIMSIRNSQKELLYVSIAYCCLFIISFLLTNRNYLYYYLPFSTIFTILIISTNFINIKKSIITTLNIIAILALIIINIPNVYYNHSISNDKIFYNFYEDANFNINNTLNFYSSETMFFKHVDEIENKYFFTPSLTYEQNPEQWDYMLENIKNKNIEYIIIKDNFGKSLPKNPLFENSYETNKKATEIYKTIKENYEEFNTYRVQTHKILMKNTFYNKWEWFPQGYKPYTIYKVKN